LHGRSLPLSVPRRIVNDLMYFSRPVPTIPAQRRMGLRQLVSARAQSSERVPWPAIFAKGYGLVAREMPELRRVYLRYPLPHLYEFETSIASVAIERVVDGENAVLSIIIKDPAALGLRQIGDKIKLAKTAPIDEVKDFQRMIGLAKMPLPLRRFIWWVGLSVGRQRGNYFGSFAISVVSGLGTDITHARSPFPVLLNYGVFDASGDVDVRVVFDHRSLDGAVVARALQRLEEVLLGCVLDEISQDTAGRQGGGA
jgi:hypothetical protein